MPINVLRFDTTPNPNAIKCVLDQIIIPDGQPPRSYRDPQSAANDPIASAIFALGSEGDITGVLMNADWITVNKSPTVNWSSLHKQLTHTLAGFDSPASQIV